MAFAWAGSSRRAPSPAVQAATPEVFAEAIVRVEDVVEEKPVT